jgi:hypothetical protein
MPTPRGGIAAAGLDGRVHVFGGESPASTFDTHEAFDVAAGAWATLEPMPTSRHGLGAAVLDGAIHVIGGGVVPGLSVSAAHEVFRD